MTEIIIILILTILNGLFSMSEIALISSRKTRLRADVDKGDKRAARALALAEHPDMFLSTVQVGITLIGLLIGIYSGDRLTDKIQLWFEQFEPVKPYAENIAMVTLLLGITYVSLVVGELVPKRVGLTYPETIAKFAAAPMGLISKIAMPFIRILTESTGLILRLFNIRKTSQSFVTEEEIKAIVSEGLEQGTVDEIEQEIVENVFEISDRSILSMMTHRSDIVWLDINDTPEAYRAKIHREVHAAYPVCDDSPDNLKGMAYLHDLFLAGPDKSLADLVKPALVIPETISAYQALDKFRARRVQEGLIVDEFGSVKGMITMNDIFSAILGEDPAEQHDEYYRWEVQDDGSVLIDGRMPFNTFLEQIEGIAEKEEVDYTTVAGFVLHHLERIPQAGDAFDWLGYRFVVELMNGHRVGKVRMRGPKPAATSKTPE